MKQKQPLVSIITVVRNAEETIFRTINSALIQKNVDFEVLVWDGLSTDGTVEKLETLKGQIQFHSGKDSGVYDAMNRSLKLAKGKWILFLNADDYFLNDDSLEKLVNLAIQGKHDYVCGFASMFFGLKVWRPKTLTDFDFFVGNPSNHQAYLCKKSAYLELGGFDLRYKYAADVDFMFRVIKAGYRGGVVSEPIVHYSLGGLSTKNVSRGVNELEEIMAKFLHSDIQFARECRFVFHEGKIPSKAFIDRLMSAKWTLSQLSQLALFFGTNYCLEETPFFVRIKNLINKIVRTIIKNLVFQILKILPNRVL